MVDIVSGVNLEQIEYSFGATLSTRVWSTKSSIGYPKMPPAVEILWDGGASAFSMELAMILEVEMALVALNDEACVGSRCLIRTCWQLRTSERSDFLRFLNAVAVSVSVGDGWIYRASKSSWWQMIHNHLITFVQR
jgi:hypothetical protein